LCGNADCAEVESEPKFGPIAIHSYCFLMGQEVQVPKINHHNIAIQPRSTHHLHPLNAFSGRPAARPLRRLHIRKDRPYPMVLTILREQHGILLAK
jgi:hypothetical protein